MAKKRGAGQKLLTLEVSEEFLDFIDDHLAMMLYSQRSQFIRDAIVEKLSQKTQVPAHFRLPPLRLGKSGPKAKPSARPSQASYEALMKKLVPETSAPKPKKPA